MASPKTDHPGIFSSPCVARGRIICWTVSVSKATDISVRSFLARRGMKKGDLSNFIEDAVKWRVFDQTLAEVRGKFADVPPEEPEALIADAVASTRAAE